MNEALVYKSFFFRRAVLRKLFDTIRFSCKQCNFSRGCPLVYPGYQRFFSHATGASFRRTQADTCSAEGRRHERRYRGSLFKTWTKPETALEKPVAPRDWGFQNRDRVCKRRVRSKKGDPWTIP